MATLRFKALEEVLNRKPLVVENPTERVSKYYAKHVFDRPTMKAYLSEEAYDAVALSIDEGARIPRRIADQVAQSMKDWAISLGATHYTHWFQPLTGTTAEKHDSFFKPSGTGQAIERFEGGNLVQQEPDASSFPSGGIRNTFEARGYTAWDPSSPAFVIGSTLCIPTIFIAYTGEALDNKMPLLRALHTVEKAAVRVCQNFDKRVQRVVCTLGWEQEYFLVDSALFYARPDLMMTGRTLFGSRPAKGQQLEDQYFGSIPERVMSFMRELEHEAHHLGIPVTTRHNEVAPNQFELAPMFEEANLANDHNLLLMDLLEKTARKHGFRVLLHEKPFAGINGSGKHNNWSLSTDTGVNLLAPGKNPKSNLQFLTFFINTIKAIHDHADILRLSVASAGNDHRLGANEAPPAIISVFIGDQLTKLLLSLEKSIKAGKMTPDQKTELKLSIGRIPEILLDNTDRNRTSPFAFTGNKFEFRAVGSSQNCAVPMAYLNTIVARQLNLFADAIDKRIEKGEKRDEAILKELQKLISQSKNILFEGNGYSDEWKKEAEKRGLSNLADTPSALTVMTRKQVSDLFESMGVFTHRELHARYEIELEKYKKQIQIESRICGDLATSFFIPVALGYQGKLVESLNNMSHVMGKEAVNAYGSATLDLIKEIGERVKVIKEQVDKMIDARRNANKIEDALEMAKVYCYEVKPYMDTIRYHVDKLELIVDDQLWPLPKLREILFTR